MEWVFRAVILCLTAGLLAAVLDRSAPSVSLLLGLAATAMVLLLSVAFLEPILRFLTRVNDVCELSGVYTRPMLKCLAIALITKIGAALCRDAKQGGAASALEFAGAAAAVWTCLPLLEAFFAMAEELL